MRVSPRIPFILILTAFIASASAVHATECLSSASVVWAAHPGSHAIWRLRLPGHIGEKCWFASSSKNQVKHANASRNAGHEIRPVNATAVPLPRPRSQDALAAIEPVPSPGSAKPALASEARSILIWGTPMRIDATWNSLFEARERIASTFARK
jgi:hypothetical protein